MRIPEKILVATDLSPTCGNIFRHAMALAADGGAELHVLNVQILRSSAYGPGRQVAAAPNTEDEINKQLRQLTADFEGRLVHKIERNERSASAILHYAKQNDIGLIVIGAHANTKISRLFLGSVAYEVLRMAELPVLVVKPDHVSSSGGYRKVLLPVDFSETPEILQRRALMLSHEDGADYRIVHAIKMDEVAQVYAPGLASYKHEKAKASLKKLVADADLPGSSEQQILSGADPVDEQIAHYAKEFGADLIVMCRADMVRVKRLILGSTTERVLRRASCPVLVRCG